MKGEVISVYGPVVDVEFPVEVNMPRIYELLNTINRKGA